MTTQTDERQGYLSASAIERAALCPGSYLAERAQPRVDESSAEAESGTRIHAALANEISEDKLSIEELELVRRCNKLLVELAGSTYGALEDADTLVREERQWFTDNDGRKLVSGKPDLVAIYGMRALLIDFKTGRGAVTHAGANLQLRALVAILSGVYKLHEVTVAIIQPNCDTPVTVACYNEDDIHAARLEVAGIVAEAQKSNARRIPNEHACRYCKARAVCPEARELALDVPTPVLKGIAPHELAAALTGEKLATFLTRASLAERIIEACREEAKRRIEAGVEVPGWSLKPGTTRETIIDPQRVFDRFVDAGGTTDGFMTCVAITKGKLKTALKDATNTKGAALDAKLDAILSECTETKQSAPSLVKNE